MKNVLNILLVTKKGEIVKRLCIILPQMSEYMKTLSMEAQTCLF